VGLVAVRAGVVVAGAGGGAGVGVGGAGEFCTAHMQVTLAVTC
ncbi:MAG: hypothetical protein QOK39_1458, partial [Acidimicrobiaceae bacterium]|nr:hypothetical protein [Acidimicrobiaceae bacterium]